MANRGARWHQGARRPGTGARRQASTSRLTTLQALSEAASSILSTRDASNEMGFELGYSLWRGSAGLGLKTCS